MLAHKHVGMQTMHASWHVDHVGMQADMAWDLAILPHWLVVEFLVISVISEQSR